MNIKISLLTAQTIVVVASIAGAVPLLLVGQPGPGWAILGMAGLIVLLGGAGRKD